MRLWVQSLALLRGLGIWHRHELWCRSKLWLWHRPAAIAPIQPLAWEPPYAMDVALKSQKKKKKKKKSKSSAAHRATAFYLQVPFGLLDVV